MTIKDYYLDLDLLNGLEEKKAERIFELYYQLCNGSSNLSGTAGSQQSYFNTLFKSGYLKNYTVENRDEKIEFINGQI